MAIWLMSTGRYRTWLSASRFMGFHAFVPGSTASVTTIEYEPGLMKDFPRAMDKLAPKGEHYYHDARWVRKWQFTCENWPFMVGPSLVVPFENKCPMLGTWQQIVFVDFDKQAAGPANGRPDHGRIKSKKLLILLLQSDFFWFSHMPRVELCESQPVIVSSKLSWAACFTLSYNPLQPKELNLKFMIMSQKCYVTPNRLSLI